MLAMVLVLQLRSVMILTEWLKQIKHLLTIVGNLIKKFIKNIKGEKNWLVIVH
jgi:hypothetical protein